MRASIIRLAAAGFVVAALAQVLPAVPVDSGGANTITDRKNFIPNRKHTPLPGTIVGVLVDNPQPILSLEGRSGPADQFCLGYAGCSYRWVYVPVEKDAMIPWINLPVGPTGAQRKRFDRLSLANRATVKPFGVDSKYALIEVEVNNGLGSPPDDSFVATKMKRVDGTERFPLKVDEVIADLTRRYQEHLKERGREIDVGMEKAAAAAIKDRKATGPRERAEVMYVTWLPDTERLRVHFRTAMTDGAYQYDGGINIELGAGAPRTRAVAAGAPAGPAGNPVGRAPQGLRYGTQFGIEFGMAYEVSKTGKVERTLTLPIETFQREIKSPGIFGDGKAAVGTMKKALPAARTMVAPRRPE